MGSFWSYLSLWREVMRHLADLLLPERPALFDFFRFPKLKPALANEKGCAALSSAPLASLPDGRLFRI